MFGSNDEPLFAFAHRLPCCLGRIGTNASALEKMESAVGKAPLFAREARETSDIVGRSFRAHPIAPKILQKMSFDAKWLYPSLKPQSAIAIGDGGSLQIWPHLPVLLVRPSLAVRGMRRALKFSAFRTKEHDA
jgi:hypothetical protein